jgi:lipoprotein-anchoring transpeptidase ErfK/SrfK
MNPNPESRHMDEKIRRALPQAGRLIQAAAPTQGLSRAQSKDRARSEAKPKAPSSRGPLYIILLGVVACLVFAFAGLSVAATPAVASMLQGAPTSTRPAHYAQSIILKPTFTPTPTVTPSPTITPLPMPTETPAQVEMAIVPEAEVSGVSAPDPAVASSSDKYILVDISEQHMYVYENGALLWSFVTSTGMNNATRAGLFHVQSKIPNAYGATWNIWMPNWLGIYYAGGLENGIHALPILPSGARLWSGFLGRPISYGCVVLGEYDSELLYNWAEIGTPVEIRR